MKLFLFLISLSTLLVASAAAIFSITGIGMLFSGHFVQVSIMAGSLEFAKLMLASFLYRNWFNISKPMRFYQTIALIVLVTITSAGIFGYLSDAYQKTKTNYTTSENIINNYNTKILFFKDRKERLSKDKNIEIKSKLSNQTRADSLTSRGIGISRTRKDILYSENKITNYDIQISSIEDSINNINTQISILKSKSLSSDLGPLIYLSKVLNISMDDVVKYFILLLIFVFDPLAVSLVIATNITIKHNTIIKNKSKYVIGDSKSPDNEKINNSKENEIKVIKKKSKKKYKPRTWHSANHHD